MQKLGRKEIDALSAQIISAAKATDVLKDCNLMLSCSDAEDWSCILHVYKGRASALRTVNAINNLLESIGIKEDFRTFLGYETYAGDYEWLFTHPSIPKRVLQRLEQETEEMLEEQLDFDYPMPEVHSDANTCFLILRGEYFKQIEEESKKIEYRTIKQYYCDKIFGRKEPLKYVLFQLGYTRDMNGKLRQMRWEVDNIVLVDDEFNEIDALTDKGTLRSLSSLPKGFIPTMYGIKLGKRIN